MCDWAPCGAHGGYIFVETVSWCGPVTKIIFFFFYFTSFLKSQTLSLNKDKHQKQCLIRIVYFNSLQCNCTLFWKELIFQKVRVCCLLCFNLLCYCSDILYYSDILCWKERKARTFRRGCLCKREWFWTFLFNFDSWTHDPFIFFYFFLPVFNNKYTSFY